MPVTLLVQHTGPSPRQNVSVQGPLIQPMAGVARCGGVLCASRSTSASFPWIPQAIALLPSAEDAGARALTGAQSPQPAPRATQA
eukprot:CAMPEP_0171074418 /NCGR_PEP_ID=MMETSP0766_2-20121228/12126_1 /TAXON_ID=439317 /ORGANISM="Gambierdiscus australes, Strain CAWD 149" /LENGTH=84 /DNA_ID=CAMNT_0011531203 /DNA_START=54 /DNA_END=305 /DNA_ORIENTATION=+